MPWANTPTARPVFTTMALFNNYLGYCYTGYTFTTQGDVHFHPAQETLILRTDGTPASITALRRINYIVVECQLTGDQNARPTTYETLYYFVDEIVIPPIFDNEPVTAVAKIRPDGWTTYGAPRNAVLLNNGAIVEQSTPFDNLVGGGADLEVDVQNATTPLYQDTTAPTSTSQIVYTPAVRHGGRATLGIFGAVDYNGAPVFVDAFYFVGMFADSAGTIYTLTRPLTTINFDGVTLNTLSTVTKIARAQVEQAGFTYYPETAGDDVTVELFAAYIVPKHFVEKQITLGGYAIKNAEGLDNNVRAAFRTINADDTGLISDSLSEYVPLSLSWSDLHRTAPQGKNVQRAVFIDIGTQHNRLQVPLDNVESDVFGIRVTSNFSTAGFSLVLEVGTQSIDVGGDFAIPVPSNTRAEYFEKNKWSLALQGVASVGGVVASVATSNPVAFVGATISAGQFAANVVQNATAPATIRGQGNGAGLFNVALIPSTSYGAVTRGAVYMRYIFGDNSLFRRRVVERYGYKWRNAVVNMSSELSKEVFGNGANIQHPKRRYIKVVNPEVIFFSTNTDFSVGGTAYVPAWAREEVNEILAKGVSLYYDPDPDEPADSEYGFGA